MTQKFKNKLFKATDGYTVMGGVVYPHQPSYLGTTQYIDSSKPKGSRAILLQEQITKARYLPLNPVEFNKTVVESSGLKQNWYMYADGMYLNYWDRGGLANLRWFQDLSADIPPLPTRSMKDVAFTQALSRIGDSPFSGAVDLGELDETLHLMKHPFKDLRNYFTGMTRDADRKIAKFSKHWRPTNPSRRKVVRDGIRIEMEKKLYTSEVLANSWLEYRYGVMPLIYSVSGLAETAAGNVESLVQAVHSARGGNKSVNTTVYGRNADRLVDGVDNFRRGTKVIDTVANGANYTIRYIYYPWMIDAIQLARYGISPTQTLSTAFELTKLSFVGDWFVNFGTWLKAMEPKPQTRIIDICYTHKYERHVHVSDNGGTISYYSYVPRIDGCYAHHDRFFMKRENVTNNVQAPIPRLKGKLLSVRHTLDAIALLSRPIQNFIGRFSKFY